MTAIARLAYVVSCLQVFNPIDPPIAPNAMFIRILTAVCSSMLLFGCAGALIGLQLGCSEDEPPATVVIPRQAKQLSLDEARQLAALYPEQWESIRQEAAGAVTETRWGTDRMTSPEPFYDQIEPCGDWFKPATRRWAEAPVEGGEAPFEFEHGFDKQGRLRTLRTRPDAGYSSSVVVYASGVTDVVRQFPMIESFEIERYVYDGDQLQYQYLIDEFSVTEWEYQYANGQIAECARRQWVTHNGWQESKTNPWYTYRVDNHGQLVRLDHRDADHPVFIKTSNRPREVVLQELEDGIVELMQSLPKEFINPASICCIALGYRNTPEAWPIIDVTVGTAPRRSAWMAETTGPASDYWSSTDLIPTEVRPRFTSELTRNILVSLRWTEPSNESPSLNREFMRAVARRLNAVDFSQSIPVTADFIVYPLDYADGADVLSDIEASVPPERLELLRARKLIPTPASGE